MPYLDFWIDLDQLIGERYKMSFVMYNTDECRALEVLAAPLVSTKKDLPQMLSE